MPKLVDYAARFAFLREAAFTLVRDRGVGHLSRRAVAAELGLSLGSVRRLLDPAVPLEQLAADEVVARRCAARWRSSVTPGTPSGDPATVAIALAQSLLPDPAQLAEEIVWLRLVLAAPQVTRRAARDAGGSSEMLSSEPMDPQLSLRERRQIADGCWTPDHLAATPDGVPDGDQDGDQDEGDHIADQVADHEEQLLATIGHVLDGLGVEGTDREHHVDALLALITGMVLEVCLGQRDVAQARSVLARHLVGLVPSPR